MLQQSVREAPEAVPSEVGHWAAQFDELGHQIASRFSRKDARLYALAYLRGLLGPVERKNGWQLAEAAGRIENCQIEVFLAYAGERRRGFIDRELYLPREWTDDPARCQAVGVPKVRAFATKPQLARAMIERALAAKMPFAWITGDETYGNDWRLRVWLEEQECAYVLAIACNRYLWRESMVQQRAQVVFNEIPDAAWRRLSAGDGAKGPRLYDWAYVPMLSWMTTQQRGLVVRRSLGQDRELAYYAVYAPFGTPLSERVTVAGRCWAIEEGFETSKQVRARPLRDSQLDRLVSSHHPSPAGARLFGLLR